MTHNVISTDDLRSAQALKEFDALRSQYADNELWLGALKLVASMATINEPPADAVILAARNALLDMGYQLPNVIVDNA
jgi:hypothetical protein